MPKRNGIELATRDGDSLVEDPCRCLALWLIWDALTALENGSRAVARWFGPNGTSNFPFWCRVAEVSPGAVRAEALRRAKSPRVKAILGGFARERPERVLQGKEMREL